MKYIASTRAEAYNEFISQTVLFGRFVKQDLKSIFVFLAHAKRPANTASFLQRDSFNSLRRNDTHSAFLQQTQTAMVDPKFHQGPSTQYQLPSMRSNSCALLYHHRRSTTHQQDRNPAVQWSISLFAGTPEIPGSINSPPFPQKTAAQSHPSAGGSPRPTARQAIRCAQTQIQPHLRSGFRSPDPLWQSPVCPNRIQPQETGKALVPSFAMLRGPSSGILARFSAPGQRGGLDRSQALHQSLPGKSPLIHCSLPHPLPSRFGVLWEKGREEGT